MTKFFGTYILPENARHYFKKPLAEIYKSQETIKKKLLQIFTTTEKIIAVGDETTKTLINAGLMPHIAIIDEHIQRSKIRFIIPQEFTVIKVSNPAASITEEAWKVIQEVLKMDDTKIIIKITGEEDLLVLPAILEAPVGSYVLYGQPNEGLVIVHVTEEKKEDVKSLIQKMVRINERGNS
ncbi:MAG: GTP-dependent dephospho-CoA kinase family protein [Candidatus Heimdallarchaeaceae archaeon]